MKSVTEAMQEGCATGSDNGVIQLLAEVEVALLDGRDYHLVDAWVLETDALRGEQDLRRQNLLLVEQDLRAVWQEVGGLMVTRTSWHVTHDAALHTYTDIADTSFGWQVIQILALQLTHGCDVAPLLFDLSDDLELSSCMKRVARSSQQLH
jgi:hypothetical protein